MGLFNRLYLKYRTWRIGRLEVRCHYDEQELELRAKIMKTSPSLRWVWEFSKKAVLICFGFYMIVQIYAMTVMFMSDDFTYLSDLITTSGELVENCVFMYLIKAGVENVGKILSSNKSQQRDPLESKFEDEVEEEEE